MTILALLKKIETAVGDAARTRLYGKIEVEFKAGAPIYLRVQKQVVLESRDSHNSRFEYQFVGQPPEQEAITADSFYSLL